MYSLTGGGGRIRTFEGVSRQIYSLLPLATRAPLHSIARLRPEADRAEFGPILLLACHGARGSPPIAVDDRAGEGTRTPNRLITNEMLYQIELRQRYP